APVTAPSTIATAIRIGTPASWTLAEQARNDSGGLIDKVTDRQIMAAYKILAAEEGVFVELASAASVAGLLQAAEAGQVPRGSRVVCTVTGNGLKDPDWALAGAPSATMVPVDALAAAAALDLACHPLSRGLSDRPRAILAQREQYTAAREEKSPR